MIKVRRMKTIRNSCEYEPYQNGAVERSWRTLTAGAREFLLRGFDMGDCEDGNELEACEYWTYAVMQSAHAYNASFSTAERKGRISHLRVPFCLAYAKTPDRYRAHKHAPQAYFLRNVLLGTSQCVTHTETFLRARYR